MSCLRVTRLLAAAALAALSGGCGAKTGLLLPDVDAATDASADAVLDAPVDVPVDAPTLPCIDLNPDAGVVTVNLDTQPRLSIADVLFMIDHTGSMQPKIDNIKANLQTTIVPAIAATIPDVQFGVVAFSDFPIGGYGDPGDVPFTLVTPIDPSVANVQGAINGLRAFGGGDNPESYVEGLYEIATGAGYAPWVTPRPACAAPGRLGYPCFRPNAQTIVMVITDAPPHNGPGGRNAYSTGAFTTPQDCPLTLPSCAAARGPHTYDEMITAMNAIHGRILAVNAGEPSYWGRDDLVQMARDTGAVTASGSPLVFDISPDGEGLDTRVVTAIQTFTSQVRFNASARVVDLDTAHPAHTLVVGLRPVSAAPASQVSRIDATTFYGVVPGTHLTFALDLRANVPQLATAQRFPARVQFLADGRPNLGHQDITIVIPGTDGSGCGMNVLPVVDAGGAGMDAGM